MKKVLLAVFGLIAILTLAACGPKNNDSKVIVTYMVDETVYKTDEIDYRAYITLPSEPTKEGYKFEYWMLNDVRYDISTSIKENITLKAFFTEGKRDYQVSFYDGNTVIKTQSVDQNSFVSTYAPTKEGYAFANWYTDTALTKIFDFSTKVTSNLSLYAKWNENSNETPGDLNAYYNGFDIEGKNGQALMDALKVRLYHGTNIKAYGGGLNSTLIAADKHPSVSGSVYTIYDGQAMSNSASGSSGASAWNKEHVIPKSWYNKVHSKNEGDVHNLRISRASINSSRGNDKFAPGNGSYKAGTNGGFYPGDAHKGDSARIAFYMITMMPDVLKIENMVSSNSKETLLKWHLEDPVDEFEIKRNEVLFKAQGNRNPFIDHPEFANAIWGSNVKTSNRLMNTKEVLVLISLTLKQIDLPSVKSSYIQAV